MSSQSKISDLNLALVGDQNISAFEISMDDGLTLQVLHAFEYLVDQAFHRGLIESHRWVVHEALKIVVQEVEYQVSRAPQLIGLRLAAARML